MSANLDSLLLDLIPKLVPELSRKFPTLDREDVEQQCWVGCLEHREQLEDLLHEGSTEQARNNAKDRATKAVLKLRTEQDRHDRAVRALAVGYEPEDVQFYSIGLLRSLLPPYLDNGVVPEPPKGRELQGPSQSDPAESGNWLALMLDVDQAFWRVKKHHRLILQRYFEFPQGQGGFTHEQIAGRLGLHPEQLKKRVYRALRAMQRELGGPK